MAEFAYYILKAEPGVCTDCMPLDGTMFLKAYLKEFQGKIGLCPKGCVVEIVGVFPDESGAQETARLIAAAGGILKNS